MPYVGVIGPGAGADATPELLALAQEVGNGLARAGATVLCGGLGGVMEAVADGVAAAGGQCVGLLPGRDRAEAGGSLTHALATGLGEARNAVLVQASDVILAIGRGYGTLSEIALALRAGKPVVGLHTWRLPDAADEIRRAGDAAEAVSLALELARA